MLRIYFMFKAQYIKTAMEYTLNFWMMVIAGILMRTLLMGVAFVLFRNIPDIAGWTEGEVYLIMALMFISEGMSDIFFNGIWDLQSMVFNGEFDVVLCRPVSPLYQILSIELGLQGIGELAMGLVSLGIALHVLGWVTPITLLLCLVFVATGVVFRLSCYLIGACSVFFNKGGGQFNIPFTMYSIGGYAKYPISIYPVWMQAILYTIIPFGFIGFVPALILRGENALPLTLLLIVAATGYFLVARAVFYRGIRRYESMGM